MMTIPGGRRRIVWQAAEKGETGAARRESLAQGSVAFNNLTIRHLFCSADSVVQRDLFQLKSTKIDVFVEHNC